MSFRVKASVTAFTAAACMLFAPAAMASSHGPIQVTGKQLKSALLPTSDFVSGYGVVYAANSGGRLEHGRIYNLPSMKCRLFWASVGVAQGFGETAFATDLVGPKSSALPSVVEIFNQTVYQFASTHASTTFLSQLNAKYRSCRSVSTSDGKGGTLRWTVHSQSKQRVGGHQALQVVEHLSDSRIPGPPAVTYLLWTTSGADIYMISTELVTTTSPKPAQSSLTLKLIARVGSLR
jgi:hypothetical protein